MTYLGMNFKNIDELKNWSKQGAINYYRKLAVRFEANPTMALSNVMSEYADILHKTFGLGWSEIEEIELSIYE